jgi:hypothetical protein
LINLPHYTYIHRCADDISRVFYVGKGVNNRYRSHEYRNKHWHSVVAKHGLFAEKVAAWETHSEALEHEKFLIACFKDMGAQLCNMTNGGDGNAGWKHTPKALAKISAAGTGRKLTDKAKVKISLANRGNKSRTGQKNSEEHKAKIGAIWKGKPLSEEHRRKLSLAKLGKKASLETRAKMSASHKKKGQ